MHSPFPLQLKYQINGSGFKQLRLLWAVLDMAVIEMHLCGGTNHEVIAFLRKRRFIVLSGSRDERPILIRNDSRLG